MDSLTYFRKGIKNGFPIFLGYLAVSTTFGIAAREQGIGILHAILISATNLTSAGQFAALGTIAAAGSYFEMALTQLIINLRYCLMSSSLSQRFSEKMKPLHRYLIAFGNTDEIFGVSSAFEGDIPPAYSYGLISVSWTGWVLGTALGALLGEFLPARILSALGVALYGMFIAIIIPPAKKNLKLMGIVAVSMALSSLFAFTPVLREISSGFRIIILTLVIGGAAALLFPVQEKEGANDEQ